MTTTLRSFDVPVQPAHKSSLPAEAPDGVPEATPTWLRDAQGRLVPISKIKPADMLQHELVVKLIFEAMALSAKLRTFRETVDTSIDSFVDLLASEYGAKRGGRKGNVTLTSFDGLMKVVVAVQDHMAFGPELQVAKALVDQCINSWSEGVNDNIRVLVLDAFQVDKQGRINRERILGLRKLAIDDPIWRQAMEAIADSQKAIGSKSYVRFYSRPTPDGAWSQIVLDLANV